MDVTAWALVGVPMTAMVIAAIAAVWIVTVALQGTASQDRAEVLRGVAEVVRAVRTIRNRQPGSGGGRA